MVESIPTAGTRSPGHPMTEHLLRHENEVFKNSGGVSEGNRSEGFKPAFLDSATGIAYQSRFADGSPAPIHVLEGLPPRLLVVSRTTGAIISGGRHLISGFLREGRFYTRAEAMDAMRHPN